MRSRNDNSRYRQKHGDTQMGSFEKKYGLNTGVRSELKLETTKKKNDDSTLMQTHAEDLKQ